MPQTTVANELLDSKEQKEEPNSLFQKGIDAYLKAHYSDAIPCFKAVEKTHSGAAVYLWMIFAYHQTNKNEKAAYEQKIDKKMVDSLIILARTHIWYQALC